jgi:hypothetical protein
MEKPLSFIFIENTKPSFFLIAQQIKTNVIETRKNIFRAEFSNLAVNGMLQCTMDTLSQASLKPLFSDSDRKL